MTLGISQKMWQTQPCRAIAGPAWRSPLFRLASIAGGAKPLVHFALPGITIEILSYYVPSQNLRMPFTAEPMAPLVFSLWLSGTGFTVLGDKSSIQVQHGKNELSFFNYSLADVELQLNAGENCQINLVVTPKALHDWMGELFSLEPHLSGQIKNGDGLAAPPRLSCLGRSLLTPPVAPSFASAYRSGAALKFLAQAVDALYMFDNAAPHIHLNKSDIARLAEVKRYIEEHLTEPPRLRDLSRLFGFNEFKLKTGFKQIYKTSVAAYAQSCRINFAHARFMRGEVNVSQCAWDMGYTNVSHFIAAFRKYFGLTPGEFIRRMR